MPTLETEYRYAIGTRVSWSAGVGQPTTIGRIKGVRIVATARASVDQENVVHIAGVQYSIDVEMVGTEPMNYATVVDEAHLARLYPPVQDAARASNGRPKNNLTMQ